MQNEKPGLHETIMLIIVAVTLGYFFLKIVFL